MTECIFGGMESRGWRQSSWQAGHLPASLLVRTESEQWNSPGVGGRADAEMGLGCVLEIGVWGLGQQSWEVGHSSVLQNGVDSV